MPVLATLTALLLAFSSTIWAAGSPLAANLRTSGVVLANSVPIPDGGTVRSGDAITTAPGSLALVTVPLRGRFEVRSDSLARLTGDHVRLERGSLATDHLAIELGRYTVQPSSAGDAWFAVANRHGRLVVAAYRGNVLIATAGASPLQVNEGSVAVQEQPGEQSATEAEQDNSLDQDQAIDNPAGPNARKNRQHKKSGARAAAGSANKSAKGTARAAGHAPGGGWTIGSLSHAASVIALVGAGAAVAGVAGAFALSGPGPSPSQ